MSPLAVATAAALFAVRLTPTRYALPAPLPLPSPSTTSTQRAGGVALGHQPFDALGSHGGTPPMAAPHLEAGQGEQSRAEGEPGAQEGLEVSAATGGVLFLLVGAGPSSLTITLCPLGLDRLLLGRLAALCSQAGLLCSGRGERQKPGAHQQLCGVGQVEPARRLPHVGPGGRSPAGLGVPRLGGSLLLHWGGLAEAFDIHGRGGRGGDVMGEAVGVVGALQARSQWLIGDFTTAVGLIWGGRASDVYRGGHSSGCYEGESVLVSVYVCVGGEVREKGIEADAGLTTVLLLLQPKWQALAWVPIPILCSSLRVLESNKQPPSSPLSPQPGMDR